MSKMKIEDAIKEVQQSQSRYQYEKFVIGQHSSPEMQYYQTVVELSSRIRNLKETELRIRKLEAEAEELLETGKKSDAVQAEIIGLQIEEIQLGLIGQRREVQILEEIYAEFPSYTREDIEAAQKDYWETRLTRVAQLQMLSRQSGVDWAQLEAVYQANIMDKALLEIPTMNHIIKNPELLTSQEEQEK